MQGVYLPETAAQNQTLPPHEPMAAQRPGPPSDPGRPSFRPPVIHRGPPNDAGLDHDHPGSIIRVGAEIRADYA